MLLDRSPLTLAGPFDLHTLGAPLAFVLSQDQTLHEKLVSRSTAERTRFFDYHSSSEEELHVQGPFLAVTPRDRSLAGRTYLVIPTV